MEIWLKKNGDCIGVVVLLKKCMKVAEKNEVQGSWNFLWKLSLIGVC